MIGLIRLPGQTGTQAPLTEIQLGRGQAGILGAELVAPGAEHQLPVGHELDGVLQIDGVGLAVVGGRRAHGVLRVIGEAAQIDEAPARGILVQELETGQELVLHSQGIEAGAEVRLQGDVLSVHFAGLRAVAVGVGRRGVGRRRGPVGTLVAGIAQLRTQLGLGRKAVLMGQRGHAGVAVIEVGTDAPEVIGGVLPGRPLGRRIERHAVVGVVPGAGMDMTHNELVIGGQPQPQAGGQTCAV